MSGKWDEKKKEGCKDMSAWLTSAGQVAGQSLVVHEHLSGGGGVGDRVLSSHVSTHNPEAAKTHKHI